MKHDNGNKLPGPRGKSSKAVSWYAFCCLNPGTEAMGRSVRAAPRQAPA